MKKEKVVKYSWSMFDKDVKALVKKHSSLLRKADSIYGVPRGGLPFAVYLSHLLNKPLVLDLSQVTENTLIVDDINDTGNMLSLIQKAIHIRTLNAITLFQNKDTMMPQIPYLRKTDKWVVFCWESEKTSRRDYARI